MTEKIDVLCEEFQEELRAIETWCAEHFTLDASVEAGPYRLHWRAGERCFLLWDGREAQEIADLDRYRCIIVARAVPALVREFHRVGDEYSNMRATPELDVLRAFRTKLAPKRIEVGGKLRTLQEIEALAEHSVLETLKLHRTWMTPQQISRNQGMSIEATQAALDRLERKDQCTRSLTSQGAYHWRGDKT